MKRKKPSAPCYQKALGILAAAEHSTEGLRRKLLLRGYAEEETEEALARLAAENYLNDRRFAELWIEFRMRRRDEGRRRLAEGLKRRGIDRQTADSAAAAAAATDEYRACLLRAWEKARAAGCEEEAALVSLLVRKGFSRSEIHACRDAT